MRAQRAEQFCNARMGHLFSLVSGSSEMRFGNDQESILKGKRPFENCENSESTLFQMLGPGLRGQLFGGGQFRNLAKSIFWSAATGQAFALVKTGHPFSLVSGARSAEKILLLQP